MVTNVKLKGIITDQTFRQIVRNEAKNIVTVESGDIKYWTQKSTFLAKKKGNQYWEIYKLNGDLALYGNV